MTLPIATLIRPAALDGQTNGRLDPAILVVVDGQAGGPDVRLVKPAARAWVAMCAAALAAGHVLKASGVHDSYRPYEVQEKIFRARYTTDVLAGRPYRRWLGRRWYQRPGTAAAAVPGTSNHGWALAVDIGEELDGDTGTESITPDAVAWLCANAHRFGFSAELQSEPWHWRYVAGDRIPDAVLAHDGPVQPTPEEDDMPLPKATLVKIKGRPEVWLAGLTVAPRQVERYADLDYHLARLGGVELVAPESLYPAAATDDIPDADGTRRRVLIADDGSLFGL